MPPPKVRGAGADVPDSPSVEEETSGLGGTRASRPWTGGGSASVEEAVAGAGAGVREEGQGGKPMRFGREEVKHLGQLEDPAS